MELRKDPITRSWVITGDDVPDMPNRLDAPCRFCADAAAPLQVIASRGEVDGVPWSARSVVHPAPLYRIEGEPTRRGDGLYDRMRSIGAHEVLVENSRHDRNLWDAGDNEIEQLLRLAAQRIKDLKGDGRIKYVSVFKNFGINAGQEFAHPNSQLTATTFVPRRVLYELRAGRDYYLQKERCVFATSSGRKSAKVCASSSCVATMWRCVPMRLESLTKRGSCHGCTTPPLNGQGCQRPAGCAILQS